MTFFEGKNFVEIGSLEIRWYAICIVIGIAIAYLYGRITIKRIGFSEDNLYTGFIGGVIVGVLGARVYYCIFNWKGFLDIFTGFRNGGLAIHGTVIAVAIFCFIFCKIRKIKFADIMELLIPGLLIGQICGRWGNFANQELYGPIVERAFLERLNIPDFVINNMDIFGNGIYYHPTFLYESAWNLVGVITLLVLRNNNRKYWIGDGVMFYGVWYSIGRIFTENLRTMSGAEEVLMTNLFGLEVRQSILISVVLIAFSVAFFIIRRIFKLDPRPYLDVLDQVKKDNEEKKKEKELEIQESN